MIPLFVIMKCFSPFGFHCVFHWLPVAAFFADKQFSGGKIGVKVCKRKRQEMSVVSGFGIRLCKKRHAPMA